MVFDRIMTPEASWASGPNTKFEGNSWVPGDGRESQWVWLIGGTDWQGFQGLYKQVSDDGIHPQWISFKVRVETTALAGAFLAVSAGRHTWGLKPLIFLFGFWGDEGSSPRRCFKMQTMGRQGTLDWSACIQQVPVVSNRAYAISVNLDWKRGLLEVYVDNEKVLCKVPFLQTESVRYVGLYNWRSGARTAFSELMLGNSQPALLVRDVGCDQGSTASNLKAMLLSVCPWRSGKLHASIGPNLTTAIIVLGLAILLQTLRSFSWPIQIG